MPSDSRANNRTSYSARMQQEIDIRVLKHFVSARFGSSSLLKKVIVAEPDYLPAEELIGKIGTWLAILREEMP